MAVETAKLLALKAFYLGHAIAEKASARADAMRMVSAALAHLSQSKEPVVRQRMAFYHLLRAEILRHGGEPLDDRLAAQRICEELRSPLYEYFMRVEDATQGRKSLSGIQTLTVNDGRIRRMSNVIGSDGWSSWLIRYDLAARALDLTERSFTEKQVYFLEHITLKEILDKHGVEFAS